VHGPAVVAASQSKARKKDPVCHKCSPPGEYPVHLDLAWHGQIEGIDTYSWVCPNCAGLVNLQTMRNPQTGEMMVRQVALNGDPREYKPHDSFKLQVNSAQGWDRSFDLTDEISPAFSIANPLQMQAMPGSFFNQQLQGRVPQPARPAQPAPMQPHPALVARHQQAIQQQRAAYQQQLAAAQANAAAQAQAGYQPLRQQVAYTLGNHPQPIRPPSPNEMRRRVLGLPPGYGRRR
jgi:hypothetical protein